MTVLEARDAAISKDETTTNPGARRSRRAA